MAQVLFREDCTIDQFIDLIEGNRKYVRCLYIYNKIDMTSIEECKRVSAQVCVTHHHHHHRSKVRTLASPVEVRTSLETARAAEMSHVFDLSLACSQPDCMVLSCRMGLNLDLFKDMLWEYLGLVRVYTKPRGKKPDFDGTRACYRHRAPPACLPATPPACAPAARLSLPS